MKSTQEKLSQRCILCPITKITDSSSRVQNASFFFFLVLPLFVMIKISGFDLLFGMSYFS